jgi:hypothetical protein
VATVYSGAQRTGLTSRGHEQGHGQVRSVAHPGSAVGNPHPPPPPSQS